MEPVKLCYPNDWTLYFGKDEFNWFLFAKKIWNQCGNFHYLEIASTAVFYGEKSGKSYRSKEGTKALLIRNKPNNYSLKKYSKIVQKYNLQGIAYIDETQRCLFPICGKVVFFFLSDVLEQIKTCHSCPLIKFSRKNNSYIRKTLGITNFPTCKELGTLLRENSCPEVCKLLYNFLLNGENR